MKIRSDRLPRPHCNVCGVLLKRLGSRTCKGCWQKGVAKPHLLGNQHAIKSGPKSDNAHRWRAREKVCPPCPCVRCGAAKAGVHHKDRDITNDNPLNLERLCQPCHLSEHRLELNAAIRNRTKANRTSTTGYRGVYRNMRGGFIARIYSNGKPHHIGTYQAAELAHIAYLTAKRSITP